MAGRHHRAHLHHIHLPADTPVHRLAPESKLAGLALFVVIVALTPRTAVAAFAVDAVVLGAVIAVARLPWRVVATRLVAIVPFVAFAVLLPFVATGRRVEVAGVSMSVDGLWASWHVLATATLGATASIVVAATTSIADVVHGLTRLRLPSLLVGILAFMFRYLDVLAAQVQRTRDAMVARAHDPRWLWQTRPLAASAGSLFVRSYERGERVHQAMRARGFTGTMPALDERRAARCDWLLAAAPAAVAGVALAATWTVGPWST